MSEGVASLNFFERIYEVATTPVDVMEGALWWVFFGHQVKQLRSVLDAKTQAEALPDADSQKAEKVWNARKAVFLKSAVTASAGAFAANWVGEVGLINFGPLQSVVSGLGFTGAALTSPLYLWDALKELNQSTIDYQNAKYPHQRRELGLRQFDIMLNIAMLVCFTAWGVLGVVYSFIGGSSLFSAVDSCFLFGGILLLARLGYAIFFLPANKQEENSVAS